jgi:NitT/TauT family transport system permease protein
MLITRERERERAHELDAELAGLDNLELADAAAVQRRRRAARLWAAAWPKLAAIVLGVALWQLVVWTHWKPEYVLPGPRAVLSELWGGLRDGTLVGAVGITARRALAGFALAVAVGLPLGAVVSQVRALRVAFGSLITGLQTMPSIAWFPLAILLFQLSERAILFVVVLGAAPAIANSLVSGADQVAPVLRRAGRVLGARGLRLWWHVVLPASVPSLLGGFKQGWAFAWRSLMAGELLVIIAERPSIGVRLQVAREFADAPALLATMVVILAIGLLVDTALFGAAERAVARRWGLREEQG